jgi:protocatechuate 3,4-dioxygenase beta subunit
MERKAFLKQGLAALGFAVVAPLISSCKKDTVSAGGCNVSPSETEGPYPTKNPTAFAIKDIKSDRTGTPLTMNITIQNVKDSCNPLAGAFVDVWHCDKDGNYSEYGSLTSVHFLRGRQTTDNNGVAAFTTVFPGWYPGRSPHIHVHVFKSLLVTQIAFPTDVCDTVYTTATNFYTKGKQDTSNTRDGIFSDSLAAQLGGVTGSVSAGYVLAHTVKVSA